MLNKYKEHLLARHKSLVYYNYLRIFFEYLDSRKLTYNDITQEVITEFLTLKHYSANSVNSLIKAGRDFFRFLQVDDSENQFCKTKTLRTERKIPNYMTEKDLGLAISYLITYNSRRMSSLKIETLLRFLFYTAVRKAELLGLKRANIDLEEKVAKVYGKGNKERYVYFPDSVKKLLEEFFKSEAEEINAFNITLGQINYIARLLKKHFPDKKMTTHLWRHSGARDMIMKGVPLGVVSKILGHSSITTTEIYTSADEPMCRDLYKEKMKGK